VETDALRCSECGGAISADAQHGHESGTSFAHVAAFAGFALAVYFLVALAMDDVFSLRGVIAFWLPIVVCLPGFYLWTMWRRRQRRQTK
jgi:Flp pilus assembly protein TadB